MAETTAGDSEEAQHPWPHVQTMFYLQTTKNNSYIMPCLLCLPKNVDISAYKNSTSNLRKHVAEAHPNPGKPFTGINIQAWLPKSQQGQEVLKLLERAFDQKLVFTVAATGGADDRVAFTDIPRARNPSECRKPGFLQEVKAALRAKFIK